MRILLVAALAAAMLAMPAPKQGLRADIRAGGRFKAAFAYDLRWGRALRLHAGAALIAGCELRFAGSVGARTSAGPVTVVLGRFPPVA